MKNVISKLRAGLGRKRSTSTAPAAVKTTAADDFLVELSVPSEDGGEPVTTRFTLGELLEIETLAELRARAAEKAARAADLADDSGAAKPRPNPEDFKGRPIGDYLQALGVPESADRYESEKGVTSAAASPRSSISPSRSRRWG